MAAPAAVTVATTATAIVSANTADRQALRLYNNSSQTIYIGEDATVTTANGYPLKAGDEWLLDTTAYEFRSGLYGIVAGGTANLRVWDITK